MEPLLIYHGNCFDGFTAAWLFSKVYPRADFYAAVYGEAPPDIAGRDVVIVDFSYPEEVMIEIAKAANMLTWLDHHKTAFEFSPRVGRLCQGAILDMARSGARILYDFYAMEDPDLFPEAEWLVDYVQDRDLWRLELPGTEAVSAFISAQPMTFKSWDFIAACGVGSVQMRGASIQDYIAMYGKKAREHSRVEMIGGYAVPTINLPYMNCSEHIGALAERFAEWKFAAGYFRRVDGRWQFSLRSRGDFDVSEVAKQFGGGGHLNAAGFDVETLPWEK